MVQPEKSISKPETYMKIGKKKDGESHTATTCNN